MNIITILQPTNFNVFVHGYFLKCGCSTRERTVLLQTEKNNNSNTKYQKK